MSCHGFKTIIKPSKEKVNEHYRKLAEIVDKYKAAQQHVLISKLAPVIKGWCNYYKTVCSKKTYSNVRHLLFWKLLRWGFRRHPKKSKSWTIDKYWLSVGTNNWTFGCKKKGTKFLLPKHSETKIVRHTKVKGNSSPYDGNTIYWGTRMGKHPELKPSVAKLLKIQKGKCNHCGLTFKPGDSIERDHIIALKAGGNNTIDNLQALHKHCHDVKTKADIKAIKRHKIRKEWNKVYKIFQKQFDDSKWTWNKDIPTLV